MAEILLCTLNARYIHASFGLRYLLANLEEMTEKTTLLEFEISQDPKDVAEEILRHSPRIVGLGVYIWNAAKTYEVISVLRRVRVYEQFCEGAKDAFATAQRIIPFLVEIGRASCRERVLQVV